MSERKSVAQIVAEEIMARIDRGEPEPGEYTCGRCYETEGVQVFAYRRINADKSVSLLARFVCPCCSFPKRCPHPERVAA